jgi:hypothetical protein
MYVVKLNGRKVTLKSLSGFKSYEAVRNALRKIFVHEVKAVFTDNLVTPSHECNR